MKIDQKKVMLVFIDGWGLSLSWRGNLLHNLGRPFLNNLYNLGYFFVLKPKSPKSKAVFRKENHAAIARGKFYQTAKNIIDKNILHKRFNSNLVLEQLAKNSVHHQSSNHIIGFLGDDGVCADLEYYFAVLKLFKKFKSDRVYLHLIVSDLEKTDRTLQNLTQLENFLIKENLGEIASLCGIDNFNQDNYQKAYISALCDARGKRAVDSSQCLIGHLSRSKSLSTLEPSLIYRAGKPIAQINDFDSILYINLIDEPFKEIAALMAFNAKKSKKLYNIDTVFLMGMVDTGKNLQNTAYHAELAFPTLADVIDRNNLRQTYLGDAGSADFIYDNYDSQNKESSDLKNIKIFNYHHKFDFETEKHLIYSICRKQVDIIKENSSPIIFTFLSSLDNTLRHGNIEQTMQVIKYLESNLLEVAHHALDNNYQLVLTSANGLAEDYQLLNNNPLARLSQQGSNNYVPMILINNPGSLLNKTTRFKPYSLESLLNTKHSVIDIAPTVLKLLDIEIPRDMRGTSLI